jgi:phenylalanyl-tRNA synthetase beta chain
MRISYNWLRQYIDLNNSIEDVAQTLTSLGLEVESIDHLGKKFEGFFVGEVLDSQRHPNADRLKLCKVRVSNEGDPLQIVCGAPNVAVGQKVIVGVVGTTVPHNQHDPGAKPFVLSKVSIRGVESYGMICSENELGIGDDASGIKVLESGAQIGTPLADYLGVNDIALEIGITPNRPDCLSHLGIARDLAAALNTKCISPKVKRFDNPKNSVTELAKVNVLNTADCPRYTVRIIQNVEVKESPEWMKRLLNAAGLRPINNVVDATNFVMLEYGQPLHAFDYDHLAQHTIVVKSADKGEKFTSLDGKVHELSGDELMICDGEKSVAIGGVMGGLNSEISAKTSTVLLEAAYFSPVSVRKTAKRLGISTDASFRFERGIDPNITDEASARAAHLIAELSGGTVVAGIIDHYPKKISEKNIALRADRVNAILGTSLTVQQIVKFLASIGINITPGKEKNEFICSIPTFRPDIDQEIDLVEEVARLYGYDNIENKTSGEVMFSAPEHFEQQVFSVRHWCESNGLNEVLTNSLIDTPTAKIFGSDLVTVKNPLSVELETLRPTLLATMLQTIAYNYNHGVSRLHLFEIGTVFSAAVGNIKSTYIEGYKEKNCIGICLSGESNLLSWHEKQRQVDLFDLKGLVLSLLRGIGLDNSDLIYYNAPTSLTEMTIGVEINNTYIGFLGKVKPESLKKFKIEHNVFFAEIDLDLLTKLQSARSYKGFSKFPTVTRDVSFIVKKSVSVGEIEKVMKLAGGLQVTAVTLFDLFEGPALGEGMKSVAFSLKINSIEKTLTDAEIDSMITVIVQSVTKTFEATLRSI